MPEYVSKVLAHFKHPVPLKPQHQPYPHIKPNYGAIAQYTTAINTPPPLNKADKKFIQEVCGIFLFPTRGVDGGLLPPLTHSPHNKQT